MGSDRYTFEQAGDKALELEALLNRFQIKVRAGNDLEAAALSAFEILERRRSASAADWTADLRPEVADVIGIAELGAQLCAVGFHPDFVHLVPHLRLLNQGHAVQTRSASVLDQAANKIFELVVACWIMAIGATDVRVDHPYASTGENPDVLFTFQSIRWGVACKALHSLNPQTIVDNVKAGVRQIKRSEAQRGIIILGGKNVVAHEEYFKLLNLEDWRSGAEPIFQGFSDPREPIARLQHEAALLTNSLRTTFGKESMLEVFSSSKVLPAVVLWAHTVAGVCLDERPTLTSVRTLAVDQLSPLDPLSLELLTRLNNAAMVHPGSAGN